MYVITPHNNIIDDVTQERNLRGYIDDLEPIIEQNARAKRIMEDKDRGRPGHYWGRDLVIEGSVPMAAFHLAPFEFDGDPDWWKDDARFQEYMKRHPSYNWLKR